MDRSRTQNSEERVIVVKVLVNVNLLLNVECCSYLHLFTTGIYYLFDMLICYFLLQKIEPTPTADLDRTNDLVYECTTNVVKAIMTLTQGKFLFVKYTIAKSLINEITV